MSDNYAKCRVTIERSDGRPNDTVVLGRARVRIVVLPNGVLAVNEAATSGQSAEMLTRYLVTLDKVANVTVVDIEDA